MARAKGRFIPGYIYHITHRYCFRPRGRVVIEGGMGYQLRKATGHHKAFPEIENGDLGFVNSCFLLRNPE